MEFTASRRGLLVPVDALSADTQPARVGEGEVSAAGVVQEPTDEGRGRDLVVKARQGAQVSAEVLRVELAARRDVTGVQRDDTVERRRQEVEHRGELADIKADERAATRQRREDERDGVEAAALAEVYRRATRAGERARIRAGIHRSAEMRALRVAAVQRAALAVGLPVLAGFAAWSTTGVQAGMAKLLHLEPGAPGWWAAWIVEPLLIAVVAGIIIVRAVLRSSGGDTDRRADRAEGCALGVSIALNLLGGWTGGGGVLDIAGEALGHCVGALGAAGTAWLIGVIIDYTTRAKPWDGADRLAEMDLLPPSTRTVRKASGRPSSGENTLRTTPRWTAFRTTSGSFCTTPGKPLPTVRSARIRPATRSTST